jgi:hypothetical protein
MKKAGGGSGVGGEDRCNIRVQVPLSATNPTNLRKLSARTMLDVELRTSRGTNSVIAVMPADRAYVGTIAYSDVEELIDCINEGFEYQATILNSSTTSAKVLVSRK